MVMTWETLLERHEFTLKRTGRYLAAELSLPHHVLSTSVVNGGQTDHVRFLLNHQSCEGAGHHDLHQLIVEIGYAGYHERVCAGASLPADATVMMGTAANMNYAAVATETDDEVEVIAIVTAGVEGNATCAGDPANWRETDAGMQKVPVHAGTINTMVLVTRPLTPGALARAAMTITEGKSAALQRLAVPSRQSMDLATGTGTDQFCIAAPAGADRVRTSTSPHVKLGELIGRAVRQATQEALRWQNGLEPSYTRGVFHALGRYGIREATFVDDISPLLDPPQLELLRKNIKALMYEPLVGAAAHALAAVLDRVRHGAIPASVQWDASVQHAAVLAANVAGRPDSWAAYRAVLHRAAPERSRGACPEPSRGGTGDDLKSLVLAALALGWADKWRSQ
jgi:adenosylcobinamide amidohydrolase